MEAVLALVPASGLNVAACAALGVSRASIHRHRTRRHRQCAIPRRRPKPQRSLSTEQRLAVLDLLREPRFVDLAPAEIYASLLDQGT